MLNALPLELVKNASLISYTIRALKPVSHPVHLVSTNHNPNVSFVTKPATHAEVALLQNVSPVPLTPTTFLL